MRKLYTKEEIILCTYAAIYDANDFGGINKIQSLEDRSIASIKMKIENIASMLDENGIQRFNTVSPLTGLPAGEIGRRTNWDIVSTLYNLKKTEFLEMCLAIVK